VKQLFENTDNATVSRVIESLFCLLNLNEEQERKEFRDKISSGAIYYFSNFLNELKLDHVSSSNLNNSKKSLEGLTQESVGAESKSALALFNWLQNTLKEVKTDDAATEPNKANNKEETKVNQIQD
jgi:hypothetical protein